MGAIKEENLRERKHRLRCKPCTLVLRQVEMFLKVRGLRVKVLFLDNAPCHSPESKLRIETDRHLSNVFPIKCDSCDLCSLNVICIKRIIAMRNRGKVKETNDI